MAKYKPAGSKKTKPASTRGLIPCSIFLVLGILLVTMLFYYSLAGQ